MRQTRALPEMSRNTCRPWMVVLFVLGMLWVAGPLEAQEVATKKPKLPPGAGAQQRENCTDNCLTFPFGVGELCSGDTCVTVPVTDANLCGTHCVDNCVDLPFDLGRICSSDACIDYLGDRYCPPSKTCGIPNTCNQTYCGPAATCFDCGGNTQETCNSGNACDSGLEPWLGVCVPSCGAAGEAPCGVRAVTPDWC